MSSRCVHRCMPVSLFPDLVEKNNHNDTSKENYKQTYNSWFAVCSEERHRQGKACNQRRRDARAVVDYSQGSVSGTAANIVMVSCWENLIRPKLSFAFVAPQQSRTKLCTTGRKLRYPRAEHRRKGTRSFNVERLFYSNITINSGNGSAIGFKTNATLVAR